MPVPSFHASANQLRLYFSASAYLMAESLRRVGLAERKLARVQSWTLRENR